MSFFKRKRYDIDFIESSSSLGSLKETSIKLAKDVDVICKETQKNKFNQFVFPNCPGMLDYSRLGYIVPSWSEIRVKCNSAGSVSVNTVSFAKKQESLRMNCDIVDGLIQPEHRSDRSVDSVFKVEGPWTIRSNNTKISYLIMPAVYHSTFLDDLYVYYGVVDNIQGFGPLSFIFSPKRKCELTIKIGDPLLHIIPIYNGEITAATGCKEHFSPNWPIAFTEVNQWYRKYIMKRKKYSLTNFFKT